VVGEKVRRLCRGISYSQTMHCANVANLNCNLLKCMLHYFSLSHTAHPHCVIYSLPHTTHTHRDTALAPFLLLLLSLRCAFYFRCSMIFNLSESTLLQLAAQLYQESCTLLFLSPSHFITPLSIYLFHSLLGHCQPACLSD